MSTDTTYAHAHGRLRTVILSLASVVGGVFLTYLTIQGEWRLAIAIAVVIPIIGISKIDIQYGVIAMLAYLIVMADLRRFLIPYVGWTANDPLLMVGPAFAIILTGYAFASGRAQVDTPLARWVMILMAIMVLQMFNPAQGGLMVGVAGALFYIVPLLWFWIGRAFMTIRGFEKLLFAALIPLAVAAAVMGYYQTFNGYLPYQEMWYDMTGYTALGAKGIEAPISFFSSSTEYSNFMIVAAIILWAAILVRKSWPLLLIVAFFVVACFLVGSRGPIVKFLATGAAMWAMLGPNRSTWIARGALGLVIALVGLVWSLNQVSTIDSSNERVAHRVTRQADGLLGAGEEDSSVRGHLGMMLHGYRRGFINPIGSGLGATTKAAVKFGGNAMNSEVDASNVMLATGIPGGIAYHVVIFLIVVTAMNYWDRSRSVVSLAFLGILGCMVLMWLQGGQYAMSSIVWVSIGALDRFFRDSEGDN